MWFRFAIQESWLHGSTKYPHTCVYLHELWVGLDDLQIFLPKSVVLWYHEMEISQEAVNSLSKYITMHLFLIYGLGPLDFFVWRAQNQVLSLKMDANWHRTCGVCVLFCHCIILYHEEVISHFIFAENQIFWMYMGHMMQRRRHNHWLKFHIVDHSCYGPVIFIQIYSPTGVDLNKDLLALYISAHIPFPSRK